MSALISPSLCCASMPPNEPSCFYGSSDTQYSLFINYSVHVIMLFLRRMHFITILLGDEIITLDLKYYEMFFTRSQTRINGLPSRAEYKQRPDTNFSVSV